MIAVEDPFATADEARVSTSSGEDIVRGGRYRLPHRDGAHKPRGWMRSTNLVSAISDQFALRLWEIGETLAGVAVSTELYTRILADAPQNMAKAERRVWTERFVELAKDASGGNKAAAHGNMRHNMVEDHHAGLPTAHYDAASRRHLHLYTEALVRTQLRALPQMQERIVLCEALETCGRLDNVLEDQRTGRWMIGDLKTKKKFWTVQELGAQLAVYANADAMWDAVAGVWVNMPPVDSTTGVLLWMPRIDPEDEDQEPRVDVYEVDLEAGWATAQLAYAVVQERQAAKSKKSRRAWLREGAAVTDTERWAARFAAVDAKADGARLVRECQAAGAWNAAVAKAARVAYERLTVTKK